MTAALYTQLGATTPAPAIENWQQAGAAISAASKAAPPPKGYYQSDFSKFNEKQAAILGTAAVVVQVVPGVGQIVGVVLGVVAAASALVSKIFFESKKKKAAAEAGQYRALNVNIQNENNLLDMQINKLKDSIGLLKKALHVEGSELGSIFNSGKKEAQRDANNEKELFAQLKKAQEEKIKLIEALYDQFNELTDTKTTRYLIYIGVAFVTLIAGILIVRSW